MAIGRQTVRVICRISIGGARVRVRISNTFGAGDLRIGAAHLALRDHGVSISGPSDRQVTFNGSSTTSIPAGALVVSDPVDLDVPALSDLAVSLYLPEAVDEDFGITGHDPSHQTCYVSTPGDFTATADFPVQAESESFVFVTGVEGLAPADTGGIVAFGDSLTEGNISTLDSNSRWPDQLARRLVERIDRAAFAPTSDPTAWDGRVAGDPRSGTLASCPLACGDEAAGAHRPRSLRGGAVRLRVGDCRTRRLPACPRCVPEPNPSPPRCVVGCGSSRVGRRDARCGPDRGCVAAVGLRPMRPARRSQGRWG